MWFLYILSWLSMILQLLFVTLAIAASLYYIAELIEEYTVMTKMILKIMLAVSCVIYLGLWLFEQFPFKLIVTGLFTNLVEYALLRSFPFIELTSPTFILTVVLVFVNHYFALQYFSDVFHPFTEVLTFFTLCLWLIPFVFFISLSASDNVLPSTMQQQSFISKGQGVVRSNKHQLHPVTSMLTTILLSYWYIHIFKTTILNSRCPDDDVLSHYMIKGKKKRSVLLTIFENCKDMVLPSRSKRFS